MSFIDRLFGRTPDAREALRPLWHATVVAAREPLWYRELGVADTVEGRFDMITLALALVMLRLEREPDQGDAAARLTELFVEDMDAQLRQSGVGDLVVGKHVGKLMATLGGRLGALREALPLGESAVAPVVQRNVSLIEGAEAGPLASALIKLHAAWGAIPIEAVLAGRLQQ
jgi:cytochrome b pre-mRNA-processing protein 3